LGSVLRNRSLVQSQAAYNHNADQIKPSHSFRNLPRDKLVFDKYVDLYDGPSSLQKRDGVPTVKEQVKSSDQFIFELERINHLKEAPNQVKDLETIKDKLYSEAATRDQALRSPIDSRREIE